jgi:hypothetical protein
VKVALGDAALSDWRIAVNVGQTQQDKCGNQKRTHRQQQLLTSFTLEQVKLAKGVTSAHDSQKGNQREQNELANLERQENPSTCVKDVPQPGQRTELRRPNRIQQIVRKNHADRNYGDPAYRQAHDCRQQDHARSERPNHTKESEWDLK